MTARLLLVLGGARSGKSAVAEAEVDRAGGSVLYVATLLPDADPRTAARVATHRARRPSSWTTVEVGPGGDVAATLAAHPRHDCVLLDGAELALLLGGPVDDAEAAEIARATARACRDGASRLAVLVSSEVGLGVVPGTAVGVEFRDRVGAANQALADLADAALLVVAGLAMRLKG